MDDDIEQFRADINELVDYFKEKNFEPDAAIFVMMGVVIEIMNSRKGNRMLALEKVFNVTRSAAEAAFLAH